MGFYNFVVSFWKIALSGVLIWIHLIAGIFTGHLVYAPPAAQPPSPAPLAASNSPSVPRTLPAAPRKVAPMSISPTSTTSSATLSPPPPPPTFTNESGQAINQEAHAAVVNILCTTGSGGYFNPISGSGVIIDAQGVILTNAHVGQYFLLKDYPTPGNVNCIIRTGSPAQATYDAELLYLPPTWVAANASEITSSQPTGTGQNDYSFLLITGTTGPSASLPSSFPALPMTLNDPLQGEEMLLDAYPAGLLGGTTIQLNLYQSSSFSTIDQLYTYTQAPNVDLFSLSGTVVSQTGSSGGAVVNPLGYLNGIIATADAGTTTARELNAITIAHINRSLASESEGGIEQLLSQNLSQAAAAFASSTAPEELQELLANLPH